MNSSRRFVPFVASCLSVFLVMSGCKRPSASQPSVTSEVTLYTAVDEPVARPILAEFERRSGVHVNVVPDTEASKTAGLADRLEAEKANPQADVWWSNEPFHTIHLAEAEVLAEYDSPAAGEIPAAYKDGKHRWAGTALRIRVIAARPQVAEGIKGIEDLAKPAFRGRIGMARPGIGTAGGHVAALYVLWGDQKADGFFRGMKANEMKLVGGNSIVADTVGRGQFDAGLTDNDDCVNAQHEGGSLVMVLPDQETIGTLAIPCTVGLVAGAKHSEAARKLIDYLLSKEVEGKLKDASFSKYSVFDDPPPGVRFMKVDYGQVSAAMPRAVARAAAILEAR
jgi:iron(III) transport system substrate-binding protein